MVKIWFLIIPFLALFLGCSGQDNVRKSTDQLEEELGAMVEELDGLANLTMRVGVGRIGYRSDPKPTISEKTSLTVRFGGAYSIDEIALVPVLWRVGPTLHSADGFPVEFKVVLGNGDEPGSTVAHFTAEDRLLPRRAPLIVPCDGEKAEWMRIEATELSESVWQNVPVLQFSEIMAFSGSENIALGGTVEAEDEIDRPFWEPMRLTDGMTPYLMDSGKGESSMGFIFNPGEWKTATLSLDLGSSLLIDRIHLHRLGIEDTIPILNHSDYGLPRKLVIRGGNQKDGSDARDLVTFGIQSPIDASPLFMLKFSEATCRYLWFQVLEPYTENGEARFGLAEIEVFAAEKNVALGREITANVERHPNRSFAVLTDGRNLRGEILPQRQWINQEWRGLKRFSCSANDAEFRRK